QRSTVQRGVHQFLVVPGWVLLVHQTQGATKVTYPVQSAAVTAVGGKPVVLSARSVLDFGGANSDGRRGAGMTFAPGDGCSAFRPAPKRAWKCRRSLPIDSAAGEAEGPDRGGPAADSYLDRAGGDASASTVCGHFGGRWSGNPP